MGLTPLHTAVVPMSKSSEFKALPSALRECLTEVAAIRREFVQPADIVLECTPMFSRLMGGLTGLLEDHHLCGSDEHYARNLVYASPDEATSLFCMVWGPGQWTPVHDHGSWGVVGVVKGALHERNYIRTDSRERDDSGIVLIRGGVSVLAAGSVTSFVPNPDHIHRAGVPRGWGETVTLHLYGRNMRGYNIYDMELGRRTEEAVAQDNP